MYNVLYVIHPVRFDIYPARRSQQRCDWMRTKVHNIFSTDGVSYMTLIYDVYLQILKKDVSKRLSVSFACEL